MIIKVEKRMHDLKCWEIRTLQMCARATQLEVGSKRIDFLIETKLSRANDWRAL